MSLALLLVTTVLASVTALTVPAQAAGVAKSVCARYDQGVRTGVCVRDPKGGVYWLGTLAAYDGKEIYCLDYGFATNWSVKHRGQTVAGGLLTSLGKTVGAPTVAALNYLVTRNPAGSVNATTAAAIGLIVREVMGDASRNGRGIPGGLRVSGVVKDVSFVPDAVIKRARNLWKEASAHRGPWSLSVSVNPGADGKVSLGEKVTATVRGRNATGRGQDLMATLSFVGFRGPKSVRLGADGVATVQLTAPATPGTASLSARADAPSGKAQIVVPNAWKKNPKPGKPSKYSQRGLLAKPTALKAAATASVRILKHLPTLVTQASAQKVEPGAKIHDTVTVSGTRGAAGTFAWSLLGPVAPQPDGSCAGTGDPAWSAAPVLATGEVVTAGDGVYVTGDYTVRTADVGCLTYVETLRESPTTGPVTTPPGIPAETFLVTKPLSTPCVTTVVSSQQAKVGSRLHDVVKIGCIAASDRVVVRWTLHGPVRPRAGVAGKAGCNAIPAATWRKAPRAASGTVTKVGPGQVSTAAFVVRRPGCYTYSETLAGTPTTKATSTVPGIAVETAIVTRPGVGRSPVIPTGPDAVKKVPATSSAGALRIPSLKVSAPISAVGVKKGSMNIPGSGSRLGWLRSTAQAADVIGAAVIAGHVADRSGRPGALSKLTKIKRGAVVVWVDAAGRSHRYKVTSVKRYPRAKALPASVFRTDGDPVLRLVTCTRKVKLAGGYHYTHNLVVTARALG